MRGQTKKFRLAVGSVVVYCIVQLWTARACCVGFFSREHHCQTIGGGVCVKQELILQRPLTAFITSCTLCTDSMIISSLAGFVLRGAGIFLTKWLCLLRLTIWNFSRGKQNIHPEGLLKGWLVETEERGSFRRRSFSMAVITIECWGRSQVGLWSGGCGAFMMTNRRRPHLEATSTCMWLHSINVFFPPHVFRPFVYTQTAF